MEPFTCADYDVIRETANVERQMSASDAFMGVPRWAENKAVERSGRCSVARYSILASLTIPSWNQLQEWLTAMQQFRDSSGFAA